MVDAAIVDGAAHLNLMWASMLAGGFGPRSGRRTCSTAASPTTTSTRPPTAGTCRSGALEPQFYDELIGGLGIARPGSGPARLRAARRAPELLTETFRSRTQAEWAEVFDGSDACCAPVLPMTEAAQHPHLKARGVYVEHDGPAATAPAPRFSRTEATLTTGPSSPAAGPAPSSRRGASRTSRRSCVRSRRPGLSGLGS